MTQNEEEQALKRSRPDESDDDSVSLVSRTPSPSPEEVKEPVDHHEVITVETKIKSTNKGFAMLSRLGWSEGQPLGLSGDGRIDPIPFQIKNDLTGLGKINQDVRMIETTVSQRRELDSERQRKETQDQRKAREDIVAKRAAVRSEISDTLRPFYCTLCEKQFQNVAQYDEHTNSYAHHHKARLKDMQANARLVNQGELEKRKEKERKREEKELRKLAKAQGIKIAKPVAAAATPSAPVLASEDETGSTNEAKSAGFKKAGWAAVSTTPNSDTDPGRPGWATANPAPPHVDEHTPHTTLTSKSLQTSGAPVFRPGGWATLDSDSPRSVLPLPSPSEPSAPPPPPPPPVDVLPLPPPSNQDEFPDRTPLSSTPPTSQRWVTVRDSDPSTSLRAPLPPPPVAPTRSGWQQWKQGVNSKRR